VEEDPVGVPLQALLRAVRQACNLLIRVFGGKPSPLNRRLCTWCIKSAHKHPGGAEVEISAIFADIRASTGLADNYRPVSSGST
jgi:hypothetical protein